MIHQVLAAVSSFVLEIIGAWGYLGVLVLMTLESANIPVPSEVIMPFSGFLAAQGDLGFWRVVFFGALGNLIGSLISYYLALFYGRRPVIFLSRLFFLNIEDLDKAESWFSRYGVFSSFLGRLIPVVRTFISFPAGIFRVPIWKFSVLTFIGSFIWSAGLAYLGYILGENWDVLGIYFRSFDDLIVLAILAGIFYMIFKRIYHKR